MTFIPRNIKKRAKDYQLIKAKQQTEFETFLLKIPVLEALQNVKTEDPMEQLFLSLMVGSDIKINVEALNLQILKDGNFLFQYDWQENILWFNYAKTYANFYDKFKMSAMGWNSFIRNQIEKYYNFRPISIADCFIDL
ncbi:MAG: hypothetical protein EKK64_08295 [Neisseriaceae bacterium]|nr:MAG: hypothetical protein EKK64_08295 [Neisseriaceae bacterium]